MSASPAHIVALLALVPAAANPSLLVAGETLFVTLCGGGTVSLPLDTPIPGSQNTACCNKGCHSDDRRRPLNKQGQQPTD